MRRGKERPDFLRPLIYTALVVLLASLIYLYFFLPAGLVLPCS